MVGGIAIALGMTAVPAEAKRPAKPTQIAPTKVRGKQRRQERRADVDRSEAGARRGILELTLGSIVLGTSGLLVSRGIWELVTSRRLANDCESGRSDALECALNPRRQGSIAAGLSFGFSAVVGVAGGFLLTRGIRIHRDYREWSRQQARIQLAPWATVRQPSAGLSLRVRF